MNPGFSILALIVLAGAVGAMTLRNLVHCALSLAVTFAGLAGLYLGLGAEFVGLAQVLVYIGAVAILIVFAILLTRPLDTTQERPFSATWLAGLAVALLVFGVLSMAIHRSGVDADGVALSGGVTVREIGELLMTWYVVPLEVVGLLLTVALIGAVIIALREDAPRSEDAAGDGPGKGIGKEKEPGHREP
jgi:NADH-quinone oxidoreductase subunit J